MEQRIERILQSNRELLAQKARKDALSGILCAQDELPAAVVITAFTYWQEAFNIRGDASGFTGFNFGAME